MEGITPGTIVERAPNHDPNNYCFTAWEYLEPAEDDTDDDTDDGTNHGATPKNPITRHKWSIQIYVTIPEASNEEYLRALVRKIHDETLQIRGGSGRHAPDRMDMYGLPLPPGTSEEETVAQCVSHQKHEIAARNATGRSDFFIPPTFDNTYNNLILIVDQPEEKWNEGEGGFLVVQFDKLPQYKSDQSDPSWMRVDWDYLGQALWQFREMIEWFYDSYVYDGTMDEDLERWHRESLEKTNAQ
ncbi:uncharacterized protein GGS25DRAFT_500149 [Hypoxylon fragiforme]|uniref:uncharacterized protein n=1 Tax=Hypoxylon fragiforme TaxID=63214 RepID=UPI0020C708B5|nr:uncharacterized protein GGS25DRAFT_500149 [Hypoxylon fragiforme]KAI2606212.1 hypothetical protein GGS25DRAFT_500149 [Hypoxylon fragiforme]